MLPLKRYQPIKFEMRNAWFVAPFVAHIVAQIKFVAQVAKRGSLLFPLVIFT